MRSLPDRYEMLMGDMAATSAITLILAVVSLAILVAFWLADPRLTLRWRLLLFVGIAVLPTLAAVSSTTEAMSVTSQRQFCGSCHVMDAHYLDATNPKSVSLASRHTRNADFGEHSCYTCHANYGMYGYPLTKLNGLLHVWHYYFGEYGDMPLDEALPKLHLYEPYKNSTCMHCHAGTGPFWKNVPDHRAIEADVRADRVSCASAGCHGAVHPFSREARKKAGVEHATEAKDAAPGKEPTRKKPAEKEPAPKDSAPQKEVAP